MIEKNINQKIKNINFESTGINHYEWSKLKKQKHFFRVFWKHFQDTLIAYFYLSTTFRLQFTVPCNHTVSFEQFREIALHV